MLKIKKTISLILVMFLLLTSCSKGRKLVSPVAPVGTEATTPSGSETKSEEKKEEPKKEEPKKEEPKKEEPKKEEPKKEEPKKEEPKKEEPKKEEPKKEEPKKEESKKEEPKKEEPKKEESKKEEPKTDYLGWISWGVSAVAYTAIAVGVTYAIYKAIDLEHEGHEQRIQSRMQF